MAFFQKSRSQNYDLYSTHAYYVPGVGGMFGLFGLMLAGSLIGSLLIAPFQLLGSLNKDWMMMITYPIMFIPPMMYASYKGRRNMLFETGYRLDNSHYAPMGGWKLALAAILGTLGCAFVLDGLVSLMPPMPEWLESLLSGLTQGDFWTNLICVSIMAPVFEEWLCRGMVLRGLLNGRTADGRPLMAPVWAIVISALFFALIHMNPWQAIPAFGLGMLMGYVYYKTGSLKLTMLMHFTNNTFALILGQIDSIPEDASFLDVMGSVGIYVLVLVVALIAVGAAVWVFKHVAQAGPQGSCDAVEAEEE